MSARADLHPEAYRRNVAKAVDRFVMAEELFNAEHLRVVALVGLERAQ